MIFGRSKETKDPIIGVDVGSEWTYLGGVTPDGTDHLTVRSQDGTGPMFPTRAVALGEETAVGHHADELFDEGGMSFDVMGPFRYGREGWEENVTALEEDPQEPPRRRFFEYLYELVEESIDDWDDRIAVPVRPARPDAGRAFLDEYLADAGFEIERRVSSPVATAVGYWEKDRYLDPHFDGDQRDGHVVLTVDMGARFIDAAVISIQHHTYRQLSVEHGTTRRSQVESYAEYKAEQNGLDISPSAENAPRRFGLLNRVHRHFPELMTGEHEEVTISVPSEFGAENGTEITLQAAEAQQLVRTQLESYGDVIQTAIDDAGLDSLDDIDLVITGGTPSRWRPLLEWWALQGGAWGLIDDPSSTVDPDATVRIASGLGGKTLAATGASALAHADVGHASHDIEIRS